MDRLRDADIAPVADQVFVAASWMRADVPPSVMTNALPVGSRTPDVTLPWMPGLPAEAQVPVSGSKRSADVTNPLRLTPPATRTPPPGRSSEACCALGLAMLAVDDQPGSTTNGAVSPARETSVTRPTRDPSASNSLAREASRTPDRLTLPRRDWPCASRTSEGWKRRTGRPRASRNSTYSPAS